MKLRIVINNTTGHTCLDTIIESGERYAHHHDDKLYKNILIDYIRKLDEAKRGEFIILYNPNNHEQIYSTTLAALKKEIDSDSMYGRTFTFGDDNG